MKTDKSDVFLCGDVFATILLVFVSNSLVVFAGGWFGIGEACADASYEDFSKAVGAGEDVLAESIGSEIFEVLSWKYKGDRGFSGLNSKLKAAAFLSRQMESQLNKAKVKKIASVAKELFGDKSRHVKDISLAVAPAKSFYETSAGVFSQPIAISELTKDEKTFLAQYYDLRLRLMITAVAQAGQSLAVAEPTFKGTHKYVLVLPLLHVAEGGSLNVGVFPRWMQRPEQLTIFSDLCLLDFGFVFHAMSLAKLACEMRNEQFSESEFYRSASKKCEGTYPDVAAECLNRVVDCVRAKEPDRAIMFEFDVVRLWLDSENYRLAAIKAKEIMEAYPEHSEAGRAIWLYYYSLSQSGDVEEILAHIDTVVDDNRVGAFKARLLYIKWWALHRKRDQAAKVAALEYELLKQYDDDPMIAPVLLSQATDLLVRQDYSSSRRLLAQLIEKFPSTKAAEQAKKMIVKMKNMGNIR